MYLEGATYKIGIELSIFGRPNVPPEMLRQCIEALDVALYQVDLIYLRLNPQTPLLYESGVRYVAEPEGAEQWMDVPRVLELGRGDCEDLSAWRAAELTLRGYPSRPYVTYQIMGDNRLLFHVAVLTPWGIDDPSRRLGMT